MDKRWVDYTQPLTMHHGYFTALLLAVCKENKGFLTLLKAWAVMLPREGEGSRPALGEGRAPCPPAPRCRPAVSMVSACGCSAGQAGACSIPSALSGISSVCPGALLILRDCGYCRSAESVSTGAISLYFPSLAPLCRMWLSPKWICFSPFPRSL